MKKSFLLSVLILLGMVLMAPAAWAGESGVDTGDTTFVLMSTALVLLMTPGLAVFYAGMVRRKNVLSTAMQSFIMICMISVQWILVGYSIAFGPDKFSLFGGLSWFGLSGVGMDPNPDYAATIPHMTFMAFQMMFAIITPALITGSFAERMRFPAFIIFSLLWSTLVYDPLCHWVWGAGGWLRSLGALDFAGGMVVHISAGVSGLVAALVLGRRLGWGSEPILPHDLPMTILGTGLLWFGWFGFNAGSALAAGGLATNTLVVTNTAAAVGALTWLVIEWLHQGKPTVLGAVSGSIAGLGAITPASGFVTPLSAIAIAFVSGSICYYAISVLKNRLGYDDSLDVFGIHGLGGIWGTLAVGLFATKAVNPLGADGLFYGNPHQLWVQFIGVAATILFTGLATLIILKLVNLITPIRARTDEEIIGLDLSVHGERAYDHII
ncbi:MAG: ammonium transporter [Firmicutes bacterium]|nr:ammonium transporter [Bacillota bacterium]